MNKVFVDTNIMLDILLDRSRLPQVKKTLANKNVYISSFSVATSYYILGRNEAISNSSFQKAIAPYKVLSINAITIEKAFEIVGEEDLEDAIQIACCIENAIDLFVTADQAIAKIYSNYVDVETIV